MKPITVIAWYDNEEGYQEEYCPGFLTSEHYAMYLAGNEVVFVGVEPSRDPAVYIKATTYLSIGKISNVREAAGVISAITQRLNEITAYEFMTDVIVRLRYDIEFDKFVIPGLLLNEC